MTDRQFELEHLQLADQHIAAATSKIADQVDRVAEIEANGGDTALAFQLLVSMRETLATFMRHRLLILATIEDASSEAKAPRGQAVGSALGGLSALSRQSEQLSK